MNCTDIQYSVISPILHILRSSFLPRQVTKRFISRQQAVVGVTAHSLYLRRSLQYTSTAKTLSLASSATTPAIQRLRHSSSFLRTSTQSRTQDLSHLLHKHNTSTSRTLSSKMASHSQPNLPTHRLKLTQTDPTRTPLILIACGSYSPITFLHLRMFEMAADFAKFNTKFEIMGGYFSPVSDAYKKAGLASAEHRLRMCELAVDQTSNWLMVDPWEAVQTEYQPTALVLDHFEHEINEVLGGVERPDGSRAKVRIALLAGADLIQTFSTPGVWNEQDLDHILGKFGCFVVERSGTDMDDALSNLQPYKHNIFVIQQLIHNDVSSTKIRLFLRREMSVQYLIPAPVIEYIIANGLYEDDGADGKGKQKETLGSGRGSPVTGSTASKS